MPARGVTFAAAGTTRRGYLALPEGEGAHPGVVVIHEAYGLNDQIRDVSRRFAGEGYAALAVDLFGDRSRVVCMARLLAGMVAGRDPYLPDLSAALAFLMAQPQVDPDRVGAIGFCMGGGLAIAWARRDQRLRAIAPFYGVNPRPLEAVRRMCPVVGSYPGRDFTARSGRRLHLHLDRIGVPHDIKIYPRARHSFFNDQRVSYDAEASADAWRRTLLFFATHVGAEPDPTSSG